LEKGDDTSLGGLGEKKGKQKRKKGPTTRAKKTRGSLVASKRFKSSLTKGAPRSRARWCSRVKWTNSRVKKKKVRENRLYNREKGLKRKHPNLQARILRALVRHGGRHAK